MKKNYLPKRPGNLLWPPGNQFQSFIDRFPDFVKRGAMPLLALLFMLNALPAFAQVNGDTCDTAIDLSTLTSPYSGTTVGATDNYSITCANGNTSPDLFYYLDVPVGYTLVIGQTVNGYDSENYLGYGGACPGTTAIACFDDDDYTTTTWVNATGSTQRVYWVQDGYNNDVQQGTFTLAWTLTAPPVCNVPRTVTAIPTSLTTADLSWTVPLTGTPTGYEYAVTTSATPPANGDAVTATTATSVTGVTITEGTVYYLHVRTTCGTDGNSAWVSTGGFRYILGDICANAIDLSTLTSPYSGTTVGANNDATYTCSGGNTSPDLYFYIPVPNGYTLVIGQTENGYDSENFVAYGTSCPGTTQLACFDDPDVQNIRWENTTGTTQNVYWIQDGYNNNVQQGTFVLAWTLTPPPPCNVPRTLNAALTSTSSANLSWEVPVTGTPTGYEYVITTSATPPAEGAAVTAVTTTTVANAATTANTVNYLYVRTTCGTDGNSAWVVYSFYSGICQPTSTSTYVGYNTVSFTTTNGFVNINNTTAQATPYTDYSNLAVSQAVGGTFNYSVVVPSYTDLEIWVDWNNDLDFSDAGEQVATHTAYTTAVTTYTGTITVPAGTAVGNYRMRARSRYYFNTFDPCAAYVYGGAQDYTLTVTTPPACYTPTNLVGAGVASGSANLSWTAPVLGGTPTGYEYAVTTTTATPVAADINTTTATTVNGYTGIVDNTYYYLQVRTVCGGGDYSEWVISTRFRFLPGDNCASAINLGALTSPLSSTTAGAANDSNYTCAGGNTSPDLFYYIEVPHGYTLVIGQTENGYDSENYVAYGTTCPGTTQLACFDDPDIQNVTWENTTGTTQNVYWIQDGYNNDVQQGTFTLAWTLTAPPACNIPRTVTATLTSVTAATVSWTVPNTGTPTGYEYAVTTDATPPATGTFTTETSVTNVPVTTNVTSYLHVRTVCGTTGFSTWVTYSFYSGICLPAPISVDGTGITNVTIGSINNTTGTETNNYGNYTAQIVNVGQGVAQPFSITFSTGATYDTKIWVDWNDNMNFDDPGEEVYSGMSAQGNPATLTGTITVPVTAALGNHRLRIGGVDFGPPTVCWTGSWGSFEDYTINVTVPPTCFTPSAAVGVATASNTANLSWAAPVLGNAPVGYEYTVDTSTSSPESGIPVTGTSVTGYTGIVDNITYYLHVRANCGNGDYSEWITSNGFKYIPGDNCSTAIDLTNLTSPYSGTTEGAANDSVYTCAGGNTSPDLFFYIEVPNGFTLVIGQTVNNYDSENFVAYGTSCPGTTQLACFDDPDIQNITWENTTGATQNVYWIQDGYNNNVQQGTFTLAWTLTGPVTCDVPRALNVALTSTTNANLSWNVPNTGNPAGYEYAVTQSATPPASGTVITGTSVTNVTVPANTALWLHVRSACGDIDGNSRWVSYPFFSGYCIPTNTASTQYYISGITTTGGDTNINNTGTGFSAYTDYSATQSVSTYAGGSIIIQATHPASRYNYGVWVDWNNDFDFDDAGESVITTIFLNSPATVGTVAVPVNTPQGNYRMRIRNAFVDAVDPCGNNNYGEAEDYTLTVVPTPTCFPPYGLSINPTDTGFAYISWNAPLLGSAPNSYEYVFGPTATAPAGNGTPVSDRFVLDAPYNPAVSNYLYVRSICGEGEFSSWISASVLDITSPEFNNSVIVYKEGNTINVTSGNTIMTGINIYDVRGRKLYSENVNATQATIDDLQVQQQVLILEVNTTKGKVSKRIIF